MKISYLIPGPMGKSDAGKSEMERRLGLLRTYAGRDTEIGIDDVPSGPASIESMYEEYLSIPETVRRAIELEHDGWDAIVLGCFGDPGLDAFRELISIPIVGPGEATALVASSLGHRFTIVTVTNSVIAATERQIRNVGVGEKLASVRAVEIPVLELHEDRTKAIDATIREGSIAIEKDRADTLIVGCMSMGFLGIAEEVSHQLGVPVLNPGKVALKYAEALVGAGISHSRKAYMFPPKLASGKVKSALELLQEKG